MGSLVITLYFVFTSTGFVVVNSEWGRKLGEELVKTRADRDTAEAQLSKAQLRHRIGPREIGELAFVLDVIRDIDLVQT